MASNFFEQQDVARKKTGQLVALFAAAVLAIVALVYGAVVLAFMLSDTQGTINSSGQTSYTVASDPPYLAAFFATLIGVIAVVGGASLFKISSLRSGGGASVATMMGGRLLHHDTAEGDERKILNVVEEMALASGTPIPPVYLMDNEKGINAFAAGYAPESAVIGITRGAVEQLSRDELQGVVAHEFSHILNGDMKLNIRLMGVIFGIIAIAVIGRVLLRSAFYSGGRRSSSKKDGGGVLVILGFGLALIVIGGVGVLFGKLIQAAVSRQREYLADASAVQFTRNPDSIGGALKRIGGGSARINDGHADEISHMFIASNASAWAFGPLATHPPLAERIKRIDPSWDGSYPEPREVKPRRSAKEKYTEKTSPIPVLGDAASGEIVGGLPGAIVGTAVLGDAMAQAGGNKVAAPVADSAIDMVGQVSAAHVQYMRSLLGSIPRPLKNAAHEAFGARAVVYAVLLDRDREVRQKQLAHLAEHADPQVNDLTRKLVEATHELAKEARLTLIDIAVPALRDMSDGQYADFKENVAVLIKADGRVELFEWVLQRLLLRHLEVHFHPAPDPNVQYYNLKPLAQPISRVLSALAHIGHREGEAAQVAFEAGAAELGLDGLAMLQRSQIKIPEVGDALDELIHVSPREKKKLIRACARAIAADGEVTRGEGELMRAVADSLGVPMPPLLPGQKLV